MNWANHVICWRQISIPEKKFQVSARICYPLKIDMDIRKFLTQFKQLVYSFTENKDSLTFMDLFQKNKLSLQILSSQTPL